MKKPWTRLSDDTLVQTPVFDLKRRVSRSPRTGEDCTFYRLDTPDWVNIVPITPDGELVLVRQYRHGTDTTTLEIPGGMMDPEDPSPEHAARRELREETGYQAERLRAVGWVHPNPAIQNTRCHTYLAEGVRQTTEQDPDDSEDLDVVLVPVHEVPRRVQDGSITHALVVCAFVFAFGLQSPPV